MRKMILRSWKREIAMILTFVMVAVSTYPAQAAIDDVYSMGFEENVGAFLGLKGATVKLGNVVKEAEKDTEKDTSKEEKIPKENSDSIVLTQKVTMKMEDGGYTDAMVDLTKVLTKTSKEDISELESIQVVVSFDKAEALAGGSATAKLYFQPNTTWSWCASSEVEVTEGKDYTLTLPISSITWGTGDTAAAAFGIQLINLKEGLKVTASVKSIKFIEKAKVSSLAVNVKSGEAIVSYVSAYDITSADIDLASYLTTISKEEITEAKSIDVVLTVDTAENFTKEKTAIAKIYFQPNSSWSWNVSPDAEAVVGKDIKISLPTSIIQWGAGDTAMGQFGVQLNNFKEGVVKYTVKSVNLTTGNSEAEVTPVQEVISEDGSAKSGSNYLQVSNRKNAMAGACVDVTDNLVAGNVYKISAWVKNNGANTDFMKLYWSISVASNGIAIAAVKATQGEWVQLEATLSVPKSAKKVILKFMSTNTISDFSIDNVEITKLKKGRTTSIKNYVVTDKNVKDGKVTLKDKTYNNLTIDASVGASTVLLDHVMVAGKLSIVGGAATIVELEDAAINQLSLVEGKITSAAIRSLAVTDIIPTIVLGPGSSLVRFLAGADVELTQDEQSILENIVVNPTANNGIKITLKNVKCNVIVEADETSPISFVLENAELGNISVNASTAGGQVDFSGDATSNIGTLNMDNSNGITTNISTPVQSLNINGNNTMVNISSVIGAIVVNGNTGSVNVAGTGVVGSVTTNGNNATILSQGKITTVNINGNNTTATVNAGTKVEIKKGADAPKVEGSTQVVNNNPIPTPEVTPTPDVFDSAGNLVVKSTFSKSFANIESTQDGVYIDYLGYFKNASTAFTGYEYIEVVMDINDISLVGSTAPALKLYTKGANWEWAEGATITAVEGETITLKIAINNIVWGGTQLKALGIKFEGANAGSRIGYTVKTIKLLIPTPDSISGDFVEFTENWGAINAELNLVNAFKAVKSDSNLKATVDKYETIKIVLDINKIVLKGATPVSAKLFTQDDLNWAWGEGASKAVSENSRITLEMPTASVMWVGDKGTATTLGKMAIQFYGAEIGTKVGYTVISTELIGLNL
ncbi:MAG: carbohydrate binding domain-containing protein, partial [Mobilitalea sp.]